MTILQIIRAALLIIGVICIVAAFTTVYRKGEAEISKDAVKTPYFKIGLVMLVGGIVMLFI